MFNWLPNSVLLSSLLLAADAQFTTRTWDEAAALASATVAQLTQDEKVGFAAGVGQFSGRCVGQTSPVQRDNITIPPLCLQDGPAGLRAVHNVTAFPAGINVASTFSRRLMHARGQALGEESRGKGVHVLLGPATDLSRNPKGGRNWESFGPDPYLTGEATYETVVGVQSVGVQACAKHYAAHNQEHYRYTIDSVIDSRTTAQMYAYPYLRAIEADVSSVMCAYNRVNGTYSCENRQLIDELRAMGFKGYVMSDWGATHGTATENANAGLDMEMPGDWILIGGGVYKPGLHFGLWDGSITDDTFNTMVTRILTPYYRLGQDQDYPPTNFDVQHSDGSGDLNEGVDVRSDAHTALVREIGAASAVLLKNSNNALPLFLDTLSSIAVVGLDAAPTKQDCGDLRLCNEGTMYIGWGSGSTMPDHVIPPIDAIQSFVGDAATLESSLTDNTDNGAAVAAGKDVALVFVNAMSGELGALYQVEGNFGDRNDLLLWHNGADLVNAVAAVNPNTVVVVHSTGPVNMEWADHPNITAIVYAGAPGEQTGPSIVDVIWGAVNPSGRLPFSIDEDEASYGTSILYFDFNPAPSINYTEQLLLDYRYMDANGITPHFEFGYGLSYTSFEYSSLEASSSGVSFQITNTGDRDGTEIPQLYVAFPAQAGEPPLVLRGFDDVFVPAGESVTVELELTGRDLSIWDTVSQSWVKQTGTFGFSVGASSKDIRLTATVEV